jgi:hypothetical protein
LQKFLERHGSTGKTLGKPGSDDSSRAEKAELKLLKQKMAVQSSALQSLEAAANKRSAEKTDTEALGREISKYIKVTPAKTRAGCNDSGQKLQLSQMTNTMGDILTKMGALTPSPAADKPADGKGKSKRKRDAWASQDQDLEDEELDRKRVKGDDDRLFAYADNARKQQGERDDAAANRDHQKFSILASLHAGALQTKSAAPGVAPTLDLFSAAGEAAMKAMAFQDQEDLLDYTTLEELVADMAPLIANPESRLTVDGAQALKVIYRRAKRKQQCPSKVPPKSPPG